MSSPNQRIRPLVAASSPLTRLKSVVFPAPLGPSSARRSPARIVSVTRSTARRPPKARETLSRTRHGEDIGKYKVQIKCKVGSRLSNLLCTLHFVLCTFTCPRVKRPLQEVHGVVFPEL